MARSIQWTVYVRSECSLCEGMLSELAQVLGPDARGVTVVDIGSDPALEERYGRKVPVLLADGDFVCAYRLDRARLQPLLTDV